MTATAGLLLVIAALTTSGWQLVALLVLGALVVGTGIAARGRDLTGRMRLRRLATVGAVAAVVAMLAAAVPATDPTPLAQSDGIQPAEVLER